MNDQNRPTAHATDDLTKADARAFMTAHGLLPNSNEHKEEVSPNVTPSKNDQISQAINQAQVARVANDKPRPVAIYVAVAIVLALVVTLGIMISAKPQAKASSSNASAGILTVPTPDTSGLPNQAQQDIKTCSNVVNAALEC